MNLYLIITEDKTENYQVADGVFIINAKNKKDAKEQFDGIKRNITETIKSIKIIKSLKHSQILFQQSVAVE